MTTEDVAEWLQVTERTVYRYLHSGELEAAKVGGQWRVKEEDLKAFLENRKPAKQGNE